MKTKINSIVIIMMLVIVNASILFTINVKASEAQPQWPEASSWIFIDEDPLENAQKDFRDVYKSYYFLDADYLYLRLECYGYPDFSAHPDSRYKWFIDTDDPHNMVWLGGNVYKANYLLFVEDTNTNGTGDIYLLNDRNGDGNFKEWEEPPNFWHEKLITDVNIANYSINDKNVSLCISLASISNPDHAYFTWSTDNANRNVGQASVIDRSDIFEADLSKADLSIKKYDDPDPVAPEELLTYTLVVTNHGPHTALNINVTDILPAEVSFINSSSDSDDNGYNGSTHWWFYSSLDVGESRIITINVTAGEEIGTITNIASVYSDTYDPVSGNNECSEDTTIAIGTTFNLFINVDGNGLVVKNPDKTSYLDGEIVELTAKHSQGWSFSHWSGDLTGSTNPQNIVMDGNKTVTAYFTEDKYVLNINIIGNGSVEIDPDKTTYLYGTMVNLTAEADPGWSLDYWGGDLSGNEIQESIVMDSDKDITVYFTDQFTLGFIIVGNGSVVKNPDQTSYAYATTVNLTAEADPGWSFSNWTGDLESEKYNETIFVDCNKYITVNFVKDCYTLNIAIVGSGSVSKNPAKNNYTYADNVELTATPASGWNFDKWGGDVTGSSNIVIINMTCDKSVTAYFSKPSSGSSGGSGGYVPPIVDNGDNQEIIDKKPTAIIGGPYFGTPNEKIEFDATESHAYEEEGLSLVRFDWKFSDDQDWQEDLGATPIYTYITPGVYNLTLKVFDNQGSSDTNTTTVTIIQPNYPPAIPEITGPENTTVNASCNFTVVSSDEDDDEIRYTIDWGDGTTTESGFLPSGTPFNTFHKWIKPGTYKIKVTADDNETISTNDLTIEIEEPEPDQTQESEFPFFILFLLFFLILLSLLILEKRRRDKSKEAQTKPKSTAKKASTKQ